jgi:hypothetical protein
MSSSKRLVNSYMIYSSMYELYTILIVMGCTARSSTAHNNEITTDSFTGTDWC